MFGEISYSQFEVATERFERKLNENGSAINEARAN